MFLVLDPVEAAPAETGALPGIAVPPRVVQVEISFVPGRSTVVPMPVSRSASEEFAMVAYVAGGREGVDILVDSVRPLRLARDRWIPGTAVDPNPDPLREQAWNYLVDASRDLETLATDALAQVEIEARQVFLEMLESARAATRLANAGLVEGTEQMAYPVIDLHPLRDGGVTYRGLRRAVADVDAAARVLREAQEGLDAARATRALVDLAWLVNLVTGGETPPLPPISTSVASEVRDLQRAAAQYSTTLAAHAERYPALVMVIGKILEETTERSQADVRAWTADDKRYDAHLDDVLRNVFGDTFRETWKAGPDLARKIFDEADDVLARVATIPAPPERIYAYHPLWRYPLIVQAALERLGHGPGSLPHAAALDALRRADAITRREAAERAETDKALDWANFGFAVLTFVPVVGQFSRCAAFAVAAVQAVRAASAYAEMREAAMAFGPNAAELGLTDPEGAGWIVFAFAGLAFDVVPVFRACGELTGSALRLARLPSPETPKLFDVVGLGIQLLLMEAATRADAAGVETPR